MRRLLAVAVLALAASACDADLHSSRTSGAESLGNQARDAATSKATTDVTGSTATPEATATPTSDPTAAAGEPVTLSQAAAATAADVPTRTLPTARPTAPLLRPLINTKIPGAERFQPGLRVKQAVVVRTTAWTGTTATVEVWERAHPSGPWTMSETGSGRVGKNGVKLDRVEGDGTTPAGMFGIPWGFGTGSNPNPRGMVWRTFDDNDYWVGDAAHAPTYNTYQTSRTSGWRLANAEHLWDFRTLYEYGWVINYNYPRFGTRPASEPQPIRTGPGSGSAIFLHVQGTGPTAGCVSIPRARLASLSAWFDPAKAPIIIIGEDDWLAG